MMDDPRKAEGEYNSHSRSSALWSLSLAMFVVGTTSLIVLGIGLEITTHFQIPNGNAGWLVTLFAGVFAVTAPFSQWVLYGRVAYHRLIQMGLLLLTAGLLWGYFAVNFHTLLASRAMCAVGGALVGPSSAAFALQLTTKDNRAKALSVVFSGFTLASVIGVPLGTWLGLHLGWRGAFGIVGLFAFVAFVVTLCVLRLVPDRETSVKPDQLMTWQTPQSVVAALATTSGFLAAQFVIYALMAAFLVDARSLPDSALPAALLAFGVAGVVGNAVAGIVSDRIGHDRIIWLSHLGLGLMFVLLSLNLGSVWAAVTLAGCAFCGTLFTAPQQARLTDSTPINRHGLLLGINVSASYVGIAMGSSLSTILFDSIGLQALPMAAFGLIVVSSVFNLLARLSTVDEKTD